MARVRSLSALAVGAALVLSLTGCGGGGGEAGPVPEGTGSVSQGVTPAGWIGGEQTTGLDWPAGWPVQFPRVGGEIIAATSEPDEGTFSVVMYVQEGVAAELIDALKAQGLTVISDHKTGGDLAAFTDGEWRIDVIGVIQDGTGKPHLRYLVQED